MSAMALNHLADEWRPAHQESKVAKVKPEAFDLPVLNSAKRPAYLPVPAGSQALASAR
jgi:hypothetical protein